MDEETQRRTIAENIAFYRKQCNQTQAELAEKLNYSDKSVSKWERAEGTPDVFVMTEIARLYGVTVNDLLSKDPPPMQRAPLPGRILISLLSIGLVWLAAAVVFAALRIALPGMQNAWMAFIFALPVSFIVLVVFTAIWWSFLPQCLATSGLIWTLAASIYLMVNAEDAAMIFLVAAVLQVLAVLWFLLRSRLSSGAGQGGGQKRTLPRRSGGKA